MVVLDQKENFITSITANFFGFENENSANFEDKKALDKFFNVSNCRLLCVQCTETDNNAVFKFTNNFVNDVKRVLIFFKVKSCTISSDNLHDVIQVTSTIGNPGSTLIESLRQVWSPALKSSGINITTLQKIEQEILGSNSPRNLNEEQDYWQEMCQQSNKSSEKKNIEEIIDIINNIKKELEQAAVAKDRLSNVDDILEIIAGHVDDLWKFDSPTYSEQQMKAFLDIIGNQSSYLIISFLEELSTNESAVKNAAVENAAIICEKWVTICERFTHLFWPHQSLHPWKGTPFIPIKCSKMGNRLRETWKFRLQYHQLTRLLTDVERSSLIAKNLLNDFDDFTVILDNDKNTEWEIMKHNFEENLIPAEERVTEKLKKQLVNVDSPIALISELQRYVELVKRKNIKEGLRSERQRLLAAVDDIIDIYQSGPDTNKLLDFPHVLQEIQAARLAEKKFGALSTLFKELIDDLSGYNDALDKINSAAKRAESQRQTLVQSWISEVQTSIAHKELTLGTDNSVVELVGTSMMKVNYNPKLVMIIKEARALAGYGIELPKEIKNLVERASTLSGRARELQKVANFHNTIGDRMIPSQRPLMLSTAMEFARAVQEQSGVVWSDLYAIDSYINRLKKHTEKFARQNSELVAKHIYIHDLVANLLKGEVVNLISSQSIWKDTLRSMRNVVDQVEGIYGNTKAWKLHWDRQLLKVLDISYRAALPNLIKKLPEIHVELAFRDNRLQWRPTLEEVRAKMYSAIRRFLTIPINFRGVGDPADAKFHTIVQKNAHLFGGVYKEAEIAISTLEKVKAKWSALAEPANVEVVDQLKGKSPQEWEKAFKDTKQWAQQIGKLSGSEIKLWCLTIDTLTTRNDLESASRKYWDRLSSNLRAEASSRLMVIAEFLSSAAKEFDYRPNNVDEVGSAFEAHERIESESPKIGDEFIAVTGLAKVMAAWTREKLDGMSGVHAAWESLTERLERHRMIVARQLEDAKINLRHRAVALNDERERWETRWSSKPDMITLEWVVSMRERWTNLQEQKDTLILDCKRVKIDIDDIIVEDTEATQRLEAELEMEESNCRFQDEFLKELEGQLNEEWSVVRRRLPRFYDWLDSWVERIKAQHKDPTNSKIQFEKTQIGKRIVELRKSVEVVQLLRGDELADEHWNELSGMLELPKNNKQLIFGDLISSVPHIRQNIDKVKEISKRAVAESGIRQAIVELEAWEASTSLQLREFKDSKANKIMLIEEYGQILSRTGELRLLLEGAKGASGYERFAARAGRCESALFELEERIKYLGLVQRKWVYLEPVYSSGAAPHDSGKWSRADKEFRFLMAEINKDPRILSLRRIGLSVVHNLKDLLDRCQKSLDDFLEEKRSAYPRLYFLNDEDLLELIAGTETGLKNHLPKLYHGINSIRQGDGLLKSIISPEGETLHLASPINILDPLPVWLTNLEEMIRLSLSENLEKCLVDKNPDLLAYPLQILLLCERIRFTEECEDVLNSGRTALKNFMQQLEHKKMKYRDIEGSGDRLSALKARGLLLDTVHHLNIARDLIKALENHGNVTWTWNRQLRCYKTHQGTFVKCSGAEFQYRFEYQGASIGLVRTSLTEKCFLALTQAMRLGLGGSPTGPAGTGKTESVKSLASMLGRLVIVFNCDEGMDATSMQRILGGLAQAGAWGCFDEFNRLEEKTLSAISMLIRPLQQALRDNLTHVQLNGQNIRLSPHCCIFITMNPAGDDYGGRNKLPDSLARLFRPIAMAHPDRYDIANALLECAGFLEANTLAKQLVETLDICDKLLSKQSHYDWGLRALRSILDTVSSLLTTTKPTNESELILQAIKASLLSKLTREDSEKMNELLKDIFTSSNITDEYELIDKKQELHSALVEITESKNLKKDVIYRCEQLYDQLKNRTGIAIVGPPGSGKSLVRKTLIEALSKIGDSVKEVSIFPGAITKTQLLGSVDLRTREWKDGLISTALVSVDANEHLWIIFNGDVEPSWVEALNSALDDNRLLTLPNGVGIKLGPHVRFIFETHELDQASPATVSRVGVLYLGTTSVSHQIACLPNTTTDSLPANARSILENQLPSIIDHFMENSKNISTSRLITSVLPHLQRSSTTNSITYILLTTICFQLQQLESQKKCATFVYQATNSWCLDPQAPLNVDYNSDVDRLEPFQADNSTIQTQSGPIFMTNILNRALKTILPWIEAGLPVLLRGQVGSGKTSLISAVLHHLKDNMESLNVVYASSIFNTCDLINQLKRVCIKVESSTAGRIYRPRNGSKIILIVEDLHLAHKSFQELLRQIIEEHGFYEDDLEFASLPVTLLSTADEFVNLHPRLDNLLISHYLHAPTSTDIQSIIIVHLQKSIRNVHYERNADLESWIHQLAPTMHESLQAISSKNTKFSWNSKDLYLWANSLIKYPASDARDKLLKYVYDVGLQLFYPKLNLNSQKRWKTFLTSKYPDFIKPPNDVYIWKTGNSALTSSTLEDWKAEIGSVVAKCEREGEPIGISVYPYLLKTITSLSWAFGCGYRGVICVGRPGAGRRSAVRLTAAFCSLKLINFGPGRGRASVKAAIQSAGVDGEPTLLLLDEHHLREGELANLASALISRGEVPGLLSPEELDGMIAPLTDLARKEDFSGSLDQFFYHRLQNLLRVVVILDTLDVQSTQMKQSNIFKDSILISDTPEHEWWTVESSLTSIGNMILSKFGVNLTSESSNPALKYLVEVHMQTINHEKSPARFTALLKTWHELQELWSQDINSQISTLEAGIDKLKEAGDRVAKLENEVSQQRKQLDIERGRADAALEQITATMRGATGQRGEMSSLKADTERESIELAKRKEAIEVELSKVTPLVEAAAQAVAGINSDALAEVRSLRAPPAAVRDILEGVLRLMGIKDTSWNSMKIFLAKRGIKDEIRNWDARRSTPASLEAVSKLIKERAESFDEKTARRASVAAAPLASWVLANMQYGRIVQQVAPLEREQRNLSDKLAAAEAQIDKLAEGLNSVESKVKKLQEELAERSRAAAALQLRAEATESNLKTARTLLDKLDVEYKDWQCQLENLNDRRNRLDIEAAEAATFLLYQNTGSEDMKKKSITDLLVTERERLIWQAQGLPEDSESIMGAICALRSPLVCFFIDPSGVAVTWLKSNLENRIEVTKPDDNKFLTVLELAVRFGKPLLIEEIIDFPSIILPLLRKQLLRLGDRTLAVQQGFKLFLATRKDRIDSIPVEADAVLLKITLGANKGSLAEQFIKKALLQDTPELEKERREALEQEEKLSGERDEARLQLLAQLATARGMDLLQESNSSQDGESSNLLTTLEATQTKAKEIARILELSRQSRDNVTKREKEYEKLAIFAANLFQTIKSLVTLSPLYVFSIDAFTDIYLEAESFRSELVNVDKNIAESQIEKKLISLTLDYCMKAALRKHRLPLALYLTLTLYPAPDVERNLLLQNNADLSIKKGENYNDINHGATPDWVPEERKMAVKILLSTIPQIAPKLTVDWIEDLTNIYKDQSLSLLQKVLIIQALRPDYLHSALTKLVRDQLEVKKISPDNWTLESLIDNNKNRPILFLLSPGADPGPEINALAGRLGIPGHFVEISLGQDQVEQAEVALENACKNGDWLLLSNLQLALNWLPKLESILRSPLCNQNKNPSTRIWLTTEECNKFYPELAGICSKIAYEPPEGVKRNLKRSLRQLRNYRSQSKSSESTFMLAWLHAILQERRRFVPHGWLRFYEWNEADLEAARELVINCALKFNPEGRLDWEEGQGLLDVAIYGGRLQDKYDMRVLEALIYDIWSQDVYQGRKKLGKVITVPEINKKEYLRMIEQLPDNESPIEFFGLPANALRAWERSTAEITISALEGIFSKFVGDSEEKLINDNDDKTQKHIIHYLKQQILQLELTKNIENRNSNPIEQFFNDERNLYEKLVDIIVSDVDNLQVTNLKTPNHWHEYWTSGSKKLTTFINGLKMRNKFLSSINLNLITQRNIINLAYLSRPRAFLAALKQHTAREMNLPLHELILKTHWIEHNDNRLADVKVSVIISGLLITGAQIKNGSLCEVSADSSSVTAAPTCRIVFIHQQNTQKDQHDNNSIEIPLYDNSKRNQLICTLDVNCTDNRRNDWLKRGVIVYLGINN